MTRQDVARVLSDPYPDQDLYDQAVFMQDHYRTIDAQPAPVPKQGYVLKTQPVASMPTNLGGVVDNLVQTAPKQARIDLRSKAMQPKIDLRSKAMQQLPDVPELSQQALSQLTEEDINTFTQEDYANLDSLPANYSLEPNRTTATTAASSSGAAHTQVVKAIPGAVQSKSGSRPPKHFDLDKLPEQDLSLGDYAISALAGFGQTSGGAVKGVGRGISAVDSVVDAALSPFDLSTPLDEAGDWVSGVGQHAIDYYQRMLDERGGENIASTVGSLVPSLVAPAKVIPQALLAAAETYGQSGSDKQAIGTGAVVGGLTKGLNKLGSYLAKEGLTLDKAFAALPEGTQTKLSSVAGRVGSTAEGLYDDIVKWADSYGIKSLYPEDFVRLAAQSDDALMEQALKAKPALNEGVGYEQTMRMRDKAFNPVGEVVDEAGGTTSIYDTDLIGLIEDYTTSTKAGYTVTDWAKVYDAALTNSEKQAAKYGSTKSLPLVDGDLPVDLAKNLPELELLSRVPDVKIAEASLSPELLKGVKGSGKAIPLPKPNPLKGPIPLPTGNLMLNVGKYVLDAVSKITKGGRDKALEESILKDITKSIAQRRITPESLAKDNIAATLKPYVEKYAVASTLKGLEPKQKRPHKYWDLDSL